VHNSPGDFARELFKPSTQWARLRVYSENKIVWFWVSDFFISGVVLDLSGPLHLALGPNR